MGTQTSILQQQETGLLKGKTFTINREVSIVFLSKNDPIPFSIKDAYNCGTGKKPSYLLQPGSVCTIDHIRKSSSVSFDSAADIHYQVIVRCGTLVDGPSRQPMPFEDSYNILFDCTELFDTLYKTEPFKYRQEGSPRLTGTQLWQVYTLIEDAELESILKEWYSNNQTFAQEEQKLTHDFIPGIVGNNQNDNR